MSVQAATSASLWSPSRCTYDMFIVQIWKEKVIFRNVDLWPSSQSCWDLNSIFNRCTHGINLKVLHCLILELSYWQTCVSTPPARPPGWQQRSQPLKPAEWNKPVKALKKEMLSLVALVASGSIITEALSLTFEVVSTQTIITEIMKHRCCKDSVLTWTSDSSTHLPGPAGLSESLCGNITLCCLRLQRNGVRWLNKIVFEWFPKPRRICARCEPGATQMVDSATAVIDSGSHDWCSHM